MSHSDWDELLAHRRDSGGPWWALPPIAVDRRATIRWRTRSRCSPSCRHIVNGTCAGSPASQTLSDVSMSYLWIEAFPGIGWSRSLPRCSSHSQPHPARREEVLQLRKVEVETQVYAAHSEWASLSQGQRMWRWLLSKQTRAQTLHAVRTALTAPHA